MIDQGAPVLSNEEFTDLMALVRRYAKKAKPKAFHEAELNELFHSLQCGEPLSITQVAVLETAFKKCKFPHSLPATYETLLSWFNANRVRLTAASEHAPLVSVKENFDSNEIARQRLALLLDTINPVPLLEWVQSSLKREFPNIEVFGENLGEVYARGHSSVRRGIPFSSEATLSHSAAKLRSIRTIFPALDPFFQNEENYSYFWFFDPSEYSYSVMPDEITKGIVIPTEVIQMELSPVLTKKVSFFLNQLNFSIVNYEGLSRWMEKTFSSAKEKFGFEFGFLADGSLRFSSLVKDDSIRTFVVIGINAQKLDKEISRLCDSIEATQKDRLLAEANSIKEHFQSRFLRRVAKIFSGL